MTNLKSRRIEICSECLDMRGRTFDFEVLEMTVWLPETCPHKAPCREEMHKPFKAQLEE